LVPGPVGAVASGVGAVRDALNGHWGSAAIGLGGAALSFFGLGVVGVAAKGTAKAARVAASASKPWKSVIVGTAHASGAHRIRTYREAIKMAKSGAYETVYINKELSTVTGGRIQSALSPDLAGVLKGNGKVLAKFNT